jgi:metallo-beta-lactamase class B
MKYYLSLLLILLLHNAISFQIFGQNTNKNSFAEIHRTKILSIIQLTPNSFQHISYKQTNDFGLVPCNGLVVRDRDEVIIFDTPVNDDSAGELIRWVKSYLGCKIIAIIPTHFHDDCLGGLNAFIKENIPSYGYNRTIELAKENGFNTPRISFKDTLKLPVGNANIIVLFPGEGHTRDNVVGYFSKDRILFGGCLIKEIDATKGFLDDANLKDWSLTVEKVKKAFPDVNIVVPGHGKAGDKKLLDYTISLFLLDISESSPDSESQYFKGVKN